MTGATSGEPGSGRPDFDLLAIGETMVLVTTDPGTAIVEGAAATISAGGAESNVAIAAAARGLRTAWYSRVGAGPLGDLVVDSICTRGVDTSAVVVDDDLPTGLMVKQPSPDGSKVVYYRSGSASSTMSPADLSAAPSARVIHVSGITAALSPSCRALLDTVVVDRALRPALVSFDVNHRPSLWPEGEAAPTLLSLARAADIVFVGRDEAEALWNTATAEAIRALLPNVPHLVVKDGSIEAVEFSPAGTSRVPAERVDVVEPVGAGDAFAAGWLAAWSRGEDATSRIAAGHASAAAVLRSPTDQADAEATRVPRLP